LLQAKKKEEKKGNISGNTVAFYLNTIFVVEIQAYS
jgi:hypothetical protein